MIKGPLKLISRRGLLIALFQVIAVVTSALGAGGVVFWGWETLPLLVSGIIAFISMLVALLISPVGSGRTPPIG